MVLFFYMRFLLKIFDMVPFDALIPIDKSSRATTIVVATIVVLKLRVFTITSLCFDVKSFCCCWCFTSRNSIVHVMFKRRPWYRFKIQIYFMLMMMVFGI
jgi:hypothetical protein